MSRAEHLVTVDGLRAAFDGDRPPVVLDVRWRLTDAAGEGRRRYAAGHLPGARFLDLETVLTAHHPDPREGRHPLPDPATLTRGLRDLGVRADDDLVVVDEPGSFAAERAWWVLRWAGLRARVLDGGVTAWVAAGGPLEQGEPAPVLPSDLQLRTGSLPVLDADAAAALPGRGTLLDARAGERYRGEVEPLDPRAGHVPGALNVPAATLYEDGRMPADAQLRERLAPALAGSPVGAYCGSGVSAARDVLALAVLGVDAALYPGSWSAWSHDPERPVAIGDPDGRTGQTLDTTG